MQLQWWKRGTCIQTYYLATQHEIENEKYIPKYFKTTKKEVSYN